MSKPLPSRPCKKVNYKNFPSLVKELDKACKHFTKNEEKEWIVKVYDLKVSKFDRVVEKVQDTYKSSTKYKPTGWCKHTKVEEDETTTTLDFYFMCV